MHLRLENRSGYDTSDLRAFFRRAFEAIVPRSHPLRRRGVEVAVVASPIRSRGCAEVGGKRMVIALASPSHYSLRRLARLVEHEAHHLLGKQHEDMTEQIRYSEGPVPSWAVGSRLRYRRRAPAQVALLSRS
jgi:hypothetical protein